MPPGTARRRIEERGPIVIAKRSRRDLLKTAVTAAAAALLPLPAIAQGARGRVVVVGGGFGGATCARFIKRIDPRITVTLVEANPTFVACPFSNGVIAGLRDLTAQEFGYDKLAADDVVVHISPGTAVDNQGRTVTLGNGTRLPYDRLVLAPGIDIRWDALPGYTEVGRRAHAARLEGRRADAAAAPPARSDGGRRDRRDLGARQSLPLPARPLRAGEPDRLLSQEQETEIEAHHSRRQGRRSPSSGCSRTPGKRSIPNLEWVSLSNDGKVTSVDAGAMTLVTDFGRHKADVANVIPPQKAGRIAELAGATDRTGWCPIDPGTFESTLAPNVHVIGDAAIAGAMPKSAFAANAQGKVCAAVVAKLLAGDKPDEPKLINTCYSLVAPDYGISVGGVYQPADGQIKEIEGSGGVSPVDAPTSTRALEATLANDWFKTITQEVFG